ncbi:hypothetical protein C7M84_008034 [Penaeus vannamei]|uniref:Ubiquitin-like protease family profile domain-containing protein n=1 Tax=Penaeus vannamei TaxID=6689 RepID=A0A3R7PQ28_PENVA|nr:hypothetical protein C7M84_008034 [Penaeus vannamei]
MHRIMAAMRSFFKRLSLFSQLRNVDKEIEEALEARRRLEEGTLVPAFFRRLFVPNIRKQELKTEGVPAEAERQLASRQQVHARLVAGNKATALVSSAPFLLGLGMLVAFVVFLVLYLLRKLFVQQGTKLKSDSGCADNNTELEDFPLSEKEVLDAPELEDFPLSEEEVLDAPELEEFSISESEVLDAAEPEEPEDFSLSEQEVLDATEPEDFSLSEQEVLDAAEPAIEPKGVAVPQTPVFYPRLSSADAEDVLLNRELSDDVIDGAMSLIAIHFPHMQGLMASGGVMFMEPFPEPQPPRFIQIVNRSTVMSLDDMSQYGVGAGSHWLTLSNVFGRRPDEVVVYDSYYGHLSPSSSALLSLLFARYPDASHRVERVQRQPDSTSCGKWAIAFAFDLALGINPGGRTYSFDAMSEHLIDAFRTGQVKPFPGAWSQALSEQEVLDATEPEDFSLSEQEVLEAPELEDFSLSEQEVLDATELSPSVSRRYLTPLNPRISPSVSRRYLTCYPIVSP